LFAFSPAAGSAIYLDCNATTPVYPEVAAAMMPYLTTHWGNPSSSHAHGRPAKAAVEEARRRVAALVNAPPSSIYFTSCGTESDNWAIASAVAAAARAAQPASPPPHVVASRIEHPAVLEYLAAQAAAGALSYSLAPCDGEGVVACDSVLQLLRPETCLVTLMHAQNETGALQPVSELAAALATAAPAVALHCDAAQSCGKVPVDVQALGVTYLTLVGHKFGAPKGVAALFARPGAPLGRLLHGGGQERGARGGTECVPLIVALGAAAELARREGEATRMHMEVLRDRLQARLLEALGGEDGRGVRVNGPSDAARRLPNTLSLGLRRVCAAKLVLALGDVVALSAGAACHEAADGKEGEPVISPTLQAMGVPLEYAMGTLRLSVGRHTSCAEVDSAAEALAAMAPRFVNSWTNRIKDGLWRLI